jgi:hypothetical protein
VHHSGHLALSGDVYLPLHFFATFFPLHQLPSVAWDHVDASWQERQGVEGSCEHLVDLQLDLEVRLKKKKDTQAFFRAYNT